MFRHAASSGAKTFDGTKVDSLDFEPYPQDGFVDQVRLANPGRPVSANWSRKDGSAGTVKFEYLIDASGRNGLLSTKYMKNRRVNERLKNIANWTYWKGAKRFNQGESNENSPFFEALQGKYYPSLP
jgi:flavin-dependent dehydrogenase